jgi:hypothetical protein
MKDFRGLIQQIYTIMMIFRYTIKDFTLRLYIPNIFVNEACVLLCLYFLGSFRHKKNRILHVKILSINLLK